MVEVAPSSGPNKIMLKDKFSMVRSHFGLLVTATGVYDSTDFIAKINQQYKAMKKKAGPTITLITPSYIVNIGGPLTLNKESFFTRGGTWTMAGGGSRRSNRARATRATRKRGHN
jgi:hypothetical protein